MVVEHDLPGRDQLEEIARGIATEEGELPDGDPLQTILDAAAGLTRYEAEGAFSLSLVRHQRVRSNAVWELKGQMLKKSGLLQLPPGGGAFWRLGRAPGPQGILPPLHAEPGPSRPATPAPGRDAPFPAGCGKSQFAKCLGNETGRPTLIFDVGALYGSLVGQTEGNIRRAIRLIEAMAPCICLIDEVEKALSGAASSGQTDSGVSARLFGTLLSWMNDRTSDVFLLATCNDISKLPPEFGRSERFDGIWFLDLPGHEQRQAIWEIYLKLFELDPKQPRPRDDSWTGAEIRACCRLAALLDVPLVGAARNVVPVSATAAESVGRLREWATGRCLDADAGGLYQQNGAATAKPRRKVRRDPSDN